jgi:hypothetical protein
MSAAPPIGQPRHTQHGRRVLVVGTIGSGKTTLRPYGAGF